MITSLLFLGLDPAKPLYEDCGPDERIDATDANFVDIMHTDTKKFGLSQLLGHIDFFPNGGRSQPSCKEKDKGTYTILINVYIIFMSKLVTWK